jgi:hypothetical protein
MNHPVIQLHPRCGFYWAITATMAANGEHVSVACAVRSFSSTPSSVQFVSALLSLLLLCLCASCAIAMRADPLLKIHPEDR